MRTLTLTKHHGLGNDFLVLLDPAGEVDEALGELARAVCDRRRGIGADGLIRLGPGLRMHLRNADGSTAEMSGNGIRCLAQAVVDAGVAPGPELEIVTDAGPKRVRVGEPCGPGGLVREVTVDMGPARILSSEPGRRAEVDLGNPHLVLADDGSDLHAVGARHPDVNVELVSVDGADLVMRVHERGVGPTLACGTGSCAAAAAAHEWGWTGPSVAVRNPGGTVHVDVKHDTTLLTGPTAFVARVEWPCR